MRRIAYKYRCSRCGHLLHEINYEDRSKHTGVRSWFDVAKMHAGMCPNCMKYLVFDRIEIKPLYNISKAGDGNGRTMTIQAVAQDASVSDDGITDEKEWRIYGSDVRGLVRASGHITFRLHDEGIGAVVANKRLYSRDDRGMISVLSYLNRVCNMLDVGDAACETAAIYVTQFMRKTGSRRLNRVVRRVIAAALYKAASQHGHALSKNDILEALEVTERDLWRATTMLHSLGILKPGSASRVREKAIAYIEKIAGELGLPHDVARDAMTLLDKSRLAATPSGFAGKNPLHLAAAVVYVVAKIRGYIKNMKTYEEMIGVKTGTIRKNLRYILDDIEITIYL